MTVSFEDNSEPGDPIRDGWGCVLKAVALGLFFVLLGLGNFLYTLNQ